MSTFPCVGDVRNLVVDVLHGLSFHSGKVARYLSARKLEHPVAIGYRSLKNVSLGIS